MDNMVFCQELAVQPRWRIVASRNLSRSFHSDGMEAIVSERYIDMLISYLSFVLPKTSAFSILYTSVLHPIILVL